MKRIATLIVLLLSCSAAYAENYFKGPWVWNESCVGGEPCWQPPNEASSGIDLRTLPQQSQRGGDGGEGIFVSDSNKIVGYQKLNKASAEAHIWNKLTNASDVDGLTAPVPLMPEKDGKIKLRFGTINKEQSLDMGSAHGTKVLARMRKDFESMPVEQGRRFLGAVKKQRGFNPVPEVNPLDPHTTITESFNKADGALGPDLSWSVFPTDDSNAKMDIVSNEANAAATSVFPNVWARAETELSSTDHYSEVIITAMSIGGGIYTSAGATVRISSDITNSTMDFYYTQLYSNVGTKQAYLQKCVNGSRTVIAQNLAYTYSLPVTYKLDATGSTITVTDGVTQVFQVTDTAVTTGTKAGIYLYRNSTGDTARLDNFEASDGINTSSRRSVIVI